MSDVKDKKFKILKNDEKNSSSDLIVGYQYRPPLEIVKEEKKVFNKEKAEIFIENMLNSYMFIYNVRLQVSIEDFNTFKQYVFNYLISIGKEMEYANFILKIIDDLFAHSKKKMFNINDVIDNIISLDKYGYNSDELLKLKESLVDAIGNKIINLDNYRKK